MAHRVRLLDATVDARVITRKKARSEFGFDSKVVFDSQPA